MPTAVGASVAIVHPASVSAAAIDPTEMNRVNQTTSRNTPAAAPSAAGVSTRERTRRRRHAFSAAEAKPHRIDVTDHRCQTSSDGCRHTIRQSLRHEHCHRAFHGVEHHRQDRRSDTERSKHVGRANIAAAHAAQIDTSPL